ncbi:aspartyl protease family protein [Massilia sp. 9I]|uniref:aspartyl protease family protein n=1 Tax=Massilia sp. 9I TaxID=2653152 RepID=UPI0012F36330|nr:aspartyl protease family protein [Massilia sp. 9I]VXC52334.1 Family clan AA aspartic protease [Massilia sp. 9I]
MRSPTFLHVLTAAVLGYALLAPAHAQQEDDPKRCRYVKIETIPIRYAGTGMNITMEGRIDGSPASLLVNLGADLTALTHTGTSRRDLTLWSTGASARGVGGYSRLYSAKLKEFVAGPTRSTRLTMPVIGDFGSPPSYDAMVGAPFLLQADLEFDLANKKLNFFRPTNCRDTFLAYWDPAAVEVPFETSWSDSPNPRFTVRLNGKKFRAMIGSGSGVSAITRSAAEEIGLKLDGPGVERLNDITGVGDDRVARFAVVVDKLEIANETITNARIGVLDTGNLGADVILGADFLRSHRVLFAMSQQKLYISCTGGAPLGHNKVVEPWLAQEADEGNADAQMSLALRYRFGYGVAQNMALARSWLEQAAANGSPEANQAMGQSLLSAGRYAPAAAHLRRALDARPGERHGALALHAARLGSGEGELGKRELAQAFARNDDEWPGPIARYYLGKINRDKLLEEARDDRKLGQARTCLALLHIAAQLRSQGDEAGAKAALEQRSNCQPRPAAAGAAP